MQWKKKYVQRRTKYVTEKIVKAISEYSNLPFDNFECTGTVEENDNMVSVFYTIGINTWVYLIIEFDDFEFNVNYCLLECEIHKKHDVSTLDYKYFDKLFVAGSFEEDGSILIVPKFTEKHFGLNLKGGIDKERLWYAVCSEKLPTEYCQQDKDIAIKKIKIFTGGKYYQIKNWTKQQIKETTSNLKVFKFFVFIFGDRLYYGKVE